MQQTSNIEDAVSKLYDDILDVRNKADELTG
jgi:hypothetical protein